ncbi:MAG: succinate--CoA ligase subunit alpha [Candidatus Aenigmarchaeota archaeon]|nr:succinate--CoA ligase subunit alpha [Candidatus Aenigmarchaeota archaeon]
MFIDKSTRVIVQGITGKQGSFHTERMIQFGTKVVAGITPGKGGQLMHGVPVFDSFETCPKADASLMFVPAQFVKNAAIDAMKHGIRFLVIITEGVPVHDMMEIKHIAQENGTRIIGPNCPGITVVGESKMGIMPNHIFRKGDVGVVSRSGTLTYEIVNALSSKGIGQSTCIGMGGDPVIGMGFVQILEAFNNDPATKRVVMIGEIGGSQEERASEFIKSKMKKKVVSYIAGRSAPPGKRMGHAGAIISGSSGTAESKIQALESAGVRVAKTPLEIADII